MDDSIHFKDADGDTLRVTHIGERVVFTTVARNAHVDDGLGVALNKAQLLTLKEFLDSEPLEALLDKAEQRHQSQ